jgi:hemerythrin
MAFLDWSPEFCGGNAEMDRQHFVLVEIVNRLHDSMKVSAPRPDVLRMIAEFAAFAERHFSREEALFPEEAELRIERRSLAMQVAALSRRLSEGSLTLSTPLLEFLRDCVRGHILQARGEFCRRLGVKENSQEGQIFQSAPS